MKTRLLSAVVVGMVVALLPVRKEAQGVQRSKREPEATLVALQPNSALVGGGTWGSLRIPATPGRSITATTASMHVFSASGGGAGSTVVRVSDGANHCDFSVACTSTNSQGEKTATGTGSCTFAPGASISVTINATTCTTTQPSVRNITVFGRWN